MIKAVQSFALALVLSVLSQSVVLGQGRATRCDRHVNEGTHRSARSHGK